jgi:DNA-binding response OmpR family regulator
MAESFAIGTQIVAEASQDIAWQFAAPVPVAIPAEEGTLLAVVPLPGSGKSLAIVGYAVPDAPAAEPEERRVTGAGLHLNHEQRRVWVEGTEVVLTFQEFELLDFLTGHPTRVFTRLELLEQVWHRDLGATSRTVDVHVSRLRQKLGPVFGRCLVTEYRVGYQFRPL